jgi:hypothetical protein
MYIPDYLIDHPQMTLNALILYTAIARKGGKGKWVEIPTKELPFYIRGYIIPPRKLLIRLGVLEFQHGRGKTSKYKLTNGLQNSKLRK